MTSLKGSPIQEDIKTIPAKAEDDNVLVSRYMRDARPEHFIFKINSMWLLSEFGIDKVESNDFDARGYKWRICFHPNGNKMRNVDTHISMYLAIRDTMSLPQGWEVNVKFKFFFYDHLRDKYLTIEDDKVHRFHSWKTKWGFDKLLSLDLFNDTSNGYLFEDSCEFGAEVFVVKYKGSIQCLDMINDAECGDYTWKIDHFSAVKENVLTSDDFKVEELKWKLDLYLDGKNVGLSLKVADDGTLPRNWKAYVTYRLLIKDQINDNDEEIEDSKWLCDSNKEVFYWRFLLITDLEDKRRGFLVNDTLIVEAVIKVIAMMKNLT